MIKIILIIIMFIILVLVFIDEDRIFNATYMDIYEYYIEKFPLPILGFYNGIIRGVHPHHKHYFNSSDFTSTKKLEDNFSIIQKEALQIYNKKKLLNMKDIGNSFFDRIDGQPKEWKVYVIKWYGEIHKNALANCPETCKIISELPDIHIAMISILEPGKIIVPHKGPSTACLRYHLGLKIPKDKNNCYIVVNGEKFYWEEGKGLIFDDTYEHSVYNNTNEPRIILFVDVERPIMFPLNYVNNFLISQSNLSEFVNNVNKVAENQSDIEKEYFTI